MHCSPARGPTAELDYHFQMELNEFNKKDTCSSDGNVSSIGNISYLRITEDKVQ